MLSVALIASSSPFVKVRVHVQSAWRTRRALREHVKVPLLPFINEVVKEEFAEVVQFPPLEPVENLTAWQVVDVPVPQFHGRR